MHMEMFLKIEGPSINGESQAVGHAGEIDVFAWSWDQNRPGRPPTQGGGNSGPLRVEDLSIVKHADTATPRLILENARGTQFDKVTLTTRRAADGFEFLIIELRQVVVSSVAIDAESENPSPDEMIAFNFAEFVVTYIPQNPDGSAGSPVVGGWNLATNTEVG